jgi:hypothetical protein
MKTEGNFIVRALNSAKSRTRLGGTILIFLGCTFSGLKTQAGTPTHQPTAIVFSNRSVNSISVSFTTAIGNPSGYLLIYKNGSSPTNGAPNDGTTYSIGNSLGGGIVGGAGTGTFVISGLASGVQYFFDIYSYNGPGGIKYLTSVAPLEGSAWTLAASPGAQPTTLTFNSITSTGLSGSFLASAPSPTGYIVLRKAGSAVTDAPSDGVLYSVGAVIGTSTVAFIGPSLSFTETSLTPTTVYHYAVFSYEETTDPTTTNYLTSTGPLTGSQSTVATAATIQATNIAFPGVTNNQLSLTWVNGNGARRVVLAHAGSAVNSNPVNTTSYSGNPAFGSGTQIGTGNYTVYDGTGNSVSVTGLTASTLYYFEVYEYNGTGVTANYLTTASSGNPSNQTTLATPATTQASNILFAGISDTQMTVTWTNGNGARHLVLAHLNTAVNSNPVNGVAYTANSIFATGTLIGTGNYAVYDGTGNSVLVSGLTASSVYNFQVFEYNGIGTTIDYLIPTAPGNPAGQTTLAALPITQANNVLFSGINTNSMTLNWTNGSGTSRLVIAHLGATVSANPLSGTPYGADPAFGSGAQIGSGNYVVYNGTGNAVTITGLNSSTGYYVEVVEYNGAGATANYLTTAAGGNPANQTTLAPPATTQAANIIFSGVSDIQMTLNWTNGNGARRIVLAHQSSAVNSNPVNGTNYVANPIFSSGTQLGAGNFVVYNGTGNSVTVTGLNNSTIYDFQVVEYNGTMNDINYLILVTGPGNPAGQTTLATPATLQARNIFFGNVTSNSLTVSWTKGNGTRRIVLAHAGTTINSFPLAIADYVANPVFGSGTLIGTGNFVVYDGTDSLVAVSGLAGATNYYFEVFEYNGSGPTANYLTTTAPANPSNQITLTYPATTQATNIIVSAISATQFTINWTAGSGTDRLVLLQAASQTNDNITNGVDYPANSLFGAGTFIGSHVVVYNGSGNAVTVTGLSPSTVYYIEVFDYNGSGTTANYLTLVAAGNPSSQSTLANPVSTQASGLVLSNISNNQATLAWTNGNGARRIVLAHAGATIDSNPANATGYSASTTFGTGSQIGIGNYVMYDGTGNTVSVTGLSSATAYYFEVFDYNGSGPDNSFNTTTSTANSSHLLTLTDAPVVSAVLAIGSTAFVISWPAITGSSGYDVDVSTDNFSTFIVGFNNLAVSLTTTSVGGLSSGTAYQCRVRSQNATGASANSNVVLVLTIPDAPVPSLGTSVTSNSFTASWSTPTGATGYFLDVSTDINFGTFLSGFNNHAVGGISSVSVGGLAAGTFYYYRVRSGNSGGISESSATISQITVPLPPQPAIASNELSHSFVANWIASQGAASYELDVTLGSSNYSTLLPGYDPLLITDTNAAVNGVQPNTIYKYRLRARNAGGVSGNSASQSVVTLDAGGGTVDPPAISVTISSISEVQALTSGGFNPSTNIITFVHRRITDPVFTTEPDITGSVANISVNPTWLDEIGMEYYFRVKDEADIKDSTNRLSNQFIYSTISNLNLTTQSNFVSGGTSETYRIFSIPLQLALSSDRIEDIFQPIIEQYGGVDKTKWRLVHYQGGQNIDYGAGLSTLDPGRSYWFNSLDPPRAITISGTVTEANQEAGFVLSLDAGFTQIGNPYPFSISWRDVLLQNADVPDIEGVGTLYTYDPAHVAFTKDAPLLVAWSGGFVHSDKAINIILPVTPKQGTLGGREENDIKTRSIDQPEWFVPITIHQGITTNSYSGPGMHPDAQPGYDRYDDFTVPRFVNFLEMNSYHQDYHTPKFSRDIVPTADHYNWNFEVESNFEDHDGVMTWNNQLLGENAAQLLLYDAQANVIIDMKKESSYRLEMGGKHLFKIFFGADANSLSPDISALGQAYPNPFVESAAIPFITSADQPDVNIELYDMMGRKVRQIVNDRFAAGYHEGIWDGADDQGGRAAQGIYIYRFVGANRPAQMGRIVLK